MTIIFKIVLVTALVSLLGMEAAGRAGTPEVVGQRAYGLITGLTGAPLRGTLDGATRDLTLGNRVAVAEELRTGQDAILEILWDRRAVILVRPHSTVMIHESKPGQTVVSLGGGSVHVALAYNSGRPTDIVTVQTPSSRVFTRGGILEVDVLPSAPSFFSRVASVFSKTEAPIGPALLETVRVVEGQSGIEPLTSSPKESQMLEAGVQARIAAGIVEQVGELPQNSAKSVGLADTDRRQGTPGPLKQRLVNVHITHALEVERLMSATSPAIDRPAPTTGSDLKGTIVATSLGVPTISLAQPGTTSGSGSTPQPTSGPVAPVTSPGVTTPLPTLPSSPVVSVPSPSVTSPLPTLPPIQVPTITTLTPSQSGGLNSRDLLRELLDDDDGNRGRGRGRGRDRGRDD